MNLEAWNRWVTLLANIGVVAGIFFLAIELRQANLATRISARDAATAGHIEFLGTILDPSVLAVAHDKALAGDELSRLETRQLDIYHARRWRHYERVYYQMRYGVISDQEWSGYEAGIDRALTGTRPFWRIARRAWDSTKTLLSRDFVDFVEARTRQAD